MYLRNIFSLVGLSVFMALAAKAAPAGPTYVNYTFTTFAGVPEMGAGARDGQGMNARFNYPGALAVDSSGVVYVADILNHTIRKISPGGEVTSLAGLAGSPGYADGHGGVARFSEPQGIVRDAAGNLFVTESAIHTIRKISPAGEVTTFAGSAGVAGTANGAGKAARFRRPSGIATDGHGNLYVADTDNHAIRKISPAGLVSTLAGMPGQSGSTNGTGSTARFYYPQGIALDTEGNVFVGDTANQLVRKVTPAGVVSTVAGSPLASGSKDGTGNEARFNNPLGLAFDPAGVLYVAEPINHLIRKVTLDGVVTTVAGKAGVSGAADGSRTNATFSKPFFVAFGPDGNVYVADTYNHAIRKVTSSGEVTTFAGSPLLSGSADGPLASARFNYTYGPVIAPDGAMYVSDVGNHTIRKIAPNGQVSTVAGLTGNPGSADGNGSTARFRTPLGLVLDKDNNLYVADAANHTIRKVTPSGDVTTLAGKAGSAGHTNGIGEAAAFNNPEGLAIDSGGNVLVADVYNHVIRKVTPTGEATTFAGSPRFAGLANGNASEARFQYPIGLAVDKTGNVYVADAWNHLIRKITPAGQVSTLAGTAGTAGNNDGPAATARFAYPYGVYAHDDGHLYVADTYNHQIRRISPEGTVVTLAGLTGTDASADGTGNEARFYYPYSVAMDASGNLFVADTYNHVIRKGHPALPDAPFADFPLAAAGLTRRLDVANATTTLWSWDLVRRPSTSYAQLTSATVRNPSFTPDVPDTFVIRFRGTDNQGRQSIGTVTLGNLKESIIPSVTITSPKNKQRLETDIVTVTGTAKDTSGIANVWCQVGNGQWQQASGTTSWSIDVRLAPGPNTLSVCAMDIAGNYSKTNAVAVTYVLTDRLIVAIQGMGSLTPDYSGSMLEVGNTYTMTAKPATGYVLAGWQDENGSGLGSASALSFVMRSNLMLTATFVPNPFVPAKGNYAGLIQLPGVHGHEQAGMITASVTDKGTFSAKLVIGGISYSLAGQFSGDGLYAGSIARKGLSALPISMHLDFARKMLTGTISDGNWTSTMRAGLAVYGKTNPLPGGARKFTMVIPGAEDSVSRPAGYGYATVSLDSAGGISVSGVLADGSKFTQKTFISSAQAWPLYAALYRGKGSIVGWMTNKSELDRDLSGVLFWTKLADPLSKTYPSGFAFPEGIEAVGSEYAYTAGSAVLPWEDGNLLLESGALSTRLSSAMELAPNGKVTGENGLKLSITTSSGLFKGTVINPGTGKPVSVTGVVMQKQRTGYGYFLNSNESGRVLFEAD